MENQAEHGEIMWKLGLYGLAVPKVMATILGGPDDKDYSIVFVVCTGVPFFLGKSP